MNHFFKILFLLFFSLSSNSLFASETASLKSNLPPKAEKPQSKDYIGPVEKISENLYVAKGARDSVPIYFGFQRVTEKTNLRGYTNATDKMVGKSHSIMRYLVMGLRKNKWPNFEKSKEFTGFESPDEDQKFKAMLEQKGFTKDGSQKGLEQITAGSDHMYGHFHKGKGGFIAFISKTPITKEITFEGLNAKTTLKKYLDVTKNLIMMIGISDFDPKQKNFTIVQGIHRTVQSMIDKGTYRGTSMMQHGFAGKVMKIMGLDYYVVHPVPAMEKILKANMKEGEEYTITEDSYSNEILEKLPGIEKVTAANGQFAIMTSSLSTLYPES